MTHPTIYLALGSNLGDRRANLTGAIDQLRAHLTITHTSSIYETAPAYVTDQPSFYNMVLQGQTALSPHDLLHTLQSIERALGRRETIRYGPRPIDLDILLYDDLQLETPELTIPHPRMSERAFVLIPLAEIASDLIIPGQTEPVQTLADHLTTEGEGQILRVVTES